MCLSLTHVNSPVISCDLLNTKSSLQAFSALPSGSGPNVLCRYLRSHPRRASLPCVHIDCPCRQSHVAHVRAKLKCGMLSMLSRALNSCVKFEPNICTLYMLYQVRVANFESNGCGQATSANSSPLCLNTAICSFLKVCNIQLLQEASEHFSIEYKYCQVVLASHRSV